MRKGCPKCGKSFEKIFKTDAKGYCRFKEHLKTNCTGEEKESEEKEIPTIACEFCGKSNKGRDKYFS